MADVISGKSQVTVTIAKPQIDEKRIVVYLSRSRFELQALELNFGNNRKRRRVKTRSGQQDQKRQQSQTLYQLHFCFIRHVKLRKRLDTSNSFYPDLYSLNDAQFEDIA